MTDKRGEVFANSAKTADDAMIGSKAIAAAVLFTGSQESRKRLVPSLPKMAADAD